MPENILPQMCEVSNRSQMTMEMERILTAKLSPEEIIKFKLWLQLVSQSLLQASRNPRRY